MDEVRQKPRLVSSLEELQVGCLVPATEVSKFKEQLIEGLTREGYKRRTYNHTNDMDCFAFMGEEVPFREEPLLIDDGGYSFNNQPILKIIVRGAQGANKHLNEKIETLLRALAFGAHPIRISSTQSGYEGAAAIL